jgi:hypothetical protein
MALNTDYNPVTDWPNEHYGSHMEYNIHTHRYVLTLDAITDVFQEQLDVLTGSQDAAEALLDEISRQVYNWMYAQLLNNSRPKLEYLIAKDPDRALYMRDAMLEQYRYARVSGGHLVSHQSGINPDTGITIDSNTIKNMVVSEAVKQSLEINGMTNKRLAFYLNPSVKRVDY